MFRYTSAHELMQEPPSILHHFDLDRRGSGAEIVEFCMIAMMILQIRGG